jgi:hypothetical protein
MLKLETFPHEAINVTVTGQRLQRPGQFRNLESETRNLIEKVDKEWTKAGEMTRDSRCKMKKTGCQAERFLKKICGFVKPGVYRRFV